MKPGKFPFCRECLIRIHDHEGLWFHGPDCDTNSQSANELYDRMDNEHEVVPSFLSARQSTSGTN